MTNFFPGYSTPSEYAEVSSSQPSPSLSSVLPDQEEMTMRNAIFNTKTGNMTISKINMEALQEDDHDYELIVMKKGSMINETYNLSELIQKTKGYSLVSEVYVNNGYNYGSTPSTPTNSRHSTLDMKQLKVKYEGTSEKPGKLLIEVEDCMDHYIPVNDSDEYEQDTLDRKTNRSSKRSAPPNNYVDSLERPSQILLTTTGSFRSSESLNASQDFGKSGNFNRVFGSLREIYEAKTRSSSFSKRDGKEPFILISDDDKGRILTLEERHSKRQRAKENAVQPDVIPPPPLDTNTLYENARHQRQLGKYLVFLFDVCQRHLSFDKIITFFVSQIPHLAIRLYHQKTPNAGAPAGNSNQMQHLILLVLLILVQTNTNSAFSRNLRKTAT